MKTVTIIIVLLTATFAQAQQTTKSVSATKIETPLKIDGVLNEAVYLQSLPAKDFTQLQPYNGQPSYQASEVHFFYDQTAIYVGAILYDEHPDSIFNYFSARDNIGMSDYFGVYLDPYNKGQLAYGFFITPSGTQTDIKAVKKDNDYEDNNWNAVWKSATNVTDSGWVVEMQIPYSALRFSDKADQAWGLNMFRNIRRYSSNNSWNYVDREVAGFIHQQGELTGIKNIKPPVRLSFTPYFASYIEENSEEGTTDFLNKGGLDVKFGITESFTLDMMLIPDFGQVQSDDKQLNLSPYEIYYSEKRQFFNEGTELFDRADIFYSRRIGACPKFSGDAKDQLNENEKIDFEPAETQLLNATKISGRTKGNLGIGFLNVMSLETNTIVKDSITGKKRNVRTQPFTNYNVMVLDQSLANNSYISIINTNVSMPDHSFAANVIGTEMQLRDKQKKYAITAKGARSDRGKSELETGYCAEIELSKNSGKLTYAFEQEIITDKFNANDLGYVRRNNILTTSGNIHYFIKEPFWIIHEWHANLHADYDRHYKPGDHIAAEINASMSARFKNNYNFWCNYGYRTNIRNYDRTRTKDRFFFEPFFMYTNMTISTDGRKNVNAWWNLGGFTHPTLPQQGFWNNFGVNMRIGQRLNCNYEFGFNKEVNDNGFYDNINDSIYMVRRHLSEMTNVLNIRYSLNNKLSMHFRARHYWSGANNYEALLLKENGYLDPDISTPTEDQNYISFNIDMIVRWVFAPGSEMSLAWKQSVSSDEEYMLNNLAENYQKTINSHEINTFSLKILYYLDYNQLKNLKLFN